MFPSPTYHVGSEWVDTSRLQELLRDTYWATGRPLAQIERAVRNSFCISAWSETAMVGFARLVTDFATHGYLCDVIVDATWRGRGIGRGLVGRLIAHEAVATCHLHLHTRDAHGVYRPLGFGERASMSKLRRRPWSDSGGA